MTFIYKDEEMDVYVSFQRAGERNYYCAPDTDIRDWVYFRIITLRDGPRQTTWLLLD